ncbi:hypothetical protein OE88DRAFT_1738413 [Heliocybe sulcata]|uniref:Uncharacterized protein n=1 Tax=Heliocybe sulcata TaxID=5364 RepID=A0A5C3MRK9_9AGAM|nr:hypothetical protein OE88DRAFT_1738413 [Heliocybe sulcata]
MHYRSPTSLLLVAALSQTTSPAAAYTCTDGSPASLVDTFSVPGYAQAGGIWVCPAPAVSALKSTLHDAGKVLGQIVSSVLDANSSAPFNLTEAPCTTYCDTPAGGGPDPNDCSYLATANAPSGTFTLPARSSLVWTWQSCQVVQSNFLEPPQNITYDYSNESWAGVIDYLAWNCQSEENAHGGSCDFYDSTNTFIQVLASAPQTTK